MPIGNVLPTQDELVERIDVKQKGDMFGFEWQEYLPYLDYDHAKKYIMAECTREEWEKDRQKLERDAILKKMAEYMGFAWEKANGCRGISANRSIMHYIAWTWLAGDHDFTKELEKRFDQEYEFYGKDILVRICEYYGWDSKRWDNGLRQNTEE